MAKKKTYTLDLQEQELGTKIDQNILGPTTDAPVTTTPINPTQPIQPILSPSSASDGSPVGTTPIQPIQPPQPKRIMKNIWIPQTLDSKIKVLRAYRKAQGIEASFDALANDALQEYVRNHISEAIEWGSA